MSKYIDAEPILQKIVVEINKSGKYTAYESGLDDAYFYVSNAHTADIQKVKHGKWIDCNWVGDGVDEHHMWRCSECIVPNYRTSRYCPYCGAKMDGKE